MADGKKSGGFLGKFGESLVHELFEDDGKGAVQTPKVTAPPTPTPSAIVSGTTPYTFGMTGSDPALSTIPGAPEPLNQDAVNAISSAVFVDLPTGKSRYLTYQNMAAALGHPSDASVPLKALRVSDPNISVAAIATDINAHLALLEQVTAKAEADFVAAAQDKLGNADKQIQALNDANANAQSEIARHQKETTDRIAQITQLQQQRAADEVAINRARSQTQAAEAAVKTSLLSAQQIFANLPTT
jgi:hypothetical protein